jgi:ligand-binding sensor domain-containing protein
MIAVHNEKDAFWRTLDETRGFSGSIITALEADSEFVWIASSSGISRLNQRNKRENPLGFEKMFKYVYIHDIELVNNQLWIASNYDLNIVDLSEERVLNFKRLGSLGNLAGMENVLTGFKVLALYNNEIMVSTKHGIWSYNFITKSWIELVDASVFGGGEILAMTRYKKYIFLATNDGFIRYDIKDRFISDYYYDFIGEIHDMKVDKKHLWLGTSNGLIKFKWTKD